MQNSKTVCITLCIAVLTQIITACGGSDGGKNNSAQTGTTTEFDPDATTQEENATVAGMLDSSTPSVQQMRSLNYIAEGQISYGATRKVYATSDKYRIQCKPPLL